MAIAGPTHHSFWRMQLSPDSHCTLGHWPSLHSPCASSRVICQLSERGGRRPFTLSGMHTQRQLAVRQFDTVDGGMQRTVQPAPLPPHCEKRLIVWVTTRSGIGASVAGASVGDSTVTSGVSASVVGAPLGASVVGASVGLELGASVGEELGASVGEELGASVSAEVSASVAGSGGGAGTVVASPRRHCLKQCRIA